MPINRFRDWNTTEVLPSDGDDVVLAVWWDEKFQQHSVCLAEYIRKFEVQTAYEPGERDEDGVLYALPGWHEITDVVGSKNRITRGPVNGIIAWTPIPNLPDSFIKRWLEKTHDKQ